MLLSDKFYRSFVLVPCEICVVPFGHRKIAADWNDITLANRESMGVSQTNAFASLTSKLSETYIVYGIAILANEHLVP